MLETRVTKLLGIKYPIICGPMVNVTYAELVSAVSNAGGLGILSAAYCPRGGLREEVKKTKSMTDKPFAVSVNVVLAGQRGESLDAFAKDINAAIEEGVDVIETVGRVPESFIKIIKDAKVKWLHRCARVRDCRTAERIGVDAVSIIGYEGAGLVGAEDVTSMVRIPAAVDAVKIPVIAAGGIGDARGFVAALALGAEGVLMGTRFMCTRECTMHPNAKKLMIETPENGLVFLLSAPVGRERVINTEYPQRINKMEAEGATEEELRPLVGAVEGHNRAFTDGDINGGPMHSGHVVGLIHDEPSCAELIERIVSEAKVIAKRLHNLGVFE